MRKKLLTICLTSVLLLGSLTSVSAITLKESFSGGTQTTSVDYDWFKGSKWKKTAWAKTKGYSKNHYVRAYIGGTSDSASGAWADTGKKYAEGDIYASCNSKQWDYNQSVYFPTAYAKYGK